MKSKKLYIIIAIIILAVTIFLLQFDFDSKEKRVNQHLDPRWQSSSVDTNSTVQNYLPVIKIDTSGQKIPGAPIFKDGIRLGNEMTLDGQTEITTAFELIDIQRNNSKIDNTINIKSLAKINIRGNSSRNFDKKSYSVNLVSTDGTQNKKELIGMSAHDEWVLNGPFLDRSLIRNYLALNISGEIMEYAPNVRYCELFIDNEYQGIYLLIERISKGENRINLQKPEKNSKITDYLIRLDREYKSDQLLNDFSYYTYKLDGSSFDVLYPGLTNLTEERKNYIEDDISKIEKSLYSYDLLDNKKGYSQYIDIDAFAEFFIINEFFGNVDAGRFSTYYYKNNKGKLTPCVWDFNNAFDNYIDYEKSNSGFHLIDQPIFNVLIKDEKFIDKVVNKYKKLRENSLNEKYLLNYVEKTDLWLGESVDRNYAKWGYVFDLTNYDPLNYLTPIDRNATSHVEAIDQLKKFIIGRGDWMDKHIEVLYQYCQESKIKNELLK